MHAKVLRGEQMCYTKFLFSNGSTTTQTKHTDKAILVKLFHLNHECILVLLVNSNLRFDQGANHLKGIPIRNHH